MMFKSTGFSFPDKDGTFQHFPAGVSVPEKLVKAMALDERGLVEKLPEPKPAKAAKKGKKE